MSIIAGSVRTKVFGFTKGGIAEKVFREMERITNAVNHGYRPAIDRFDPYSGQYEGQEIMLLLLENEHALHEYCAIQRLDPQRECVLIKDGRADQSRRIAWGEHEVVLRPTSDEKTITHLANLILSAFLRHGFGWYGVPEEGANAQTTFSPYPWGGSARKLPPDQAYKVGRGGTVVMNLLSSTGRTVTDPAQIAELGGNDFIRELVGFDEPVAMYGSTGVVNTFELLQLLKVGSFLGKPVVFDSDDYAFDLKYYWERSLNPCLRLLEIEASLEELGLYPEAKLTSIIQTELMSTALRKWGFGTWWEMRRLAFQNHQISFGEWYRWGARFLASKILELIGTDVNFKIVPSAEIYQKLPLWRAGLYGLGTILYEESGRSVGVVNMPNGRLVSSYESITPPMTVGQALEKGWWLSGAAVYRTMYSLGLRGGIVYMVKDSKAGLVHLLARQYLTNEKSGLRLCPVGLFRMHAEGQAEDDHIDAWVLLELIHRWGDDKARQIFQQIWEAIEVPLERKNIGNKTVVTFSLDGARIEVKEDR